MDQLISKSVLLPLFLLLTGFCSKAQTLKDNNKSNEHHYGLNVSGAYVGGRTEAELKNILLDTLVKANTNKGKNNRQLAINSHRLKTNRDSLSLKNFDFKLFPGSDVGVGAKEREKSSIGLGIINNANISRSSNETVEEVSEADKKAQRGISNKRYSYADGKYVGARKLSREKD